MAEEFYSDSIRVSMPLRKALALFDMVEDYPILKGRIRQLECEVDGLRANQSRLMIMLGDLKKSM